MPMLESTPVVVRLVVEVDGHTLTFEETGKARGARYLGEDPRTAGYSTDDTLEKSIRGTFDTCIARTAKRSEDFLSRAYPVCADDAST